MRTETLEAIQLYIEVSYAALKRVQNIGPGADLSPLLEAKNRLWDALQNEIGPIKEESAIQKGQ